MSVVLPGKGCTISAQSAGGVQMKESGPSGEIAAVLAILSYCELFGMCLVILIGQDAVHICYSIPQNRDIWFVSAVTE